MIIDSSIADHYFDKNTVEDIKQHWIFNSIENNKCLCEDPPKDNYEKLKRIYDLILEALKKFTPLNFELWEAFFGTYNYNNNEVTVYITVGIPDPYDGITMEDSTGNKCVILDLERISSYSSDEEEIIRIIGGLITHEMAHVYFDKDHECPSWDSDIDVILKYITFNEGIAHFLGRDENVLDIEWDSEEMRKRKEKAYSQLLKNLNNNIEEEREKILMNCNCGRYWDKFASISGMFALVDYYNLHNRDIKAFGELYKKGQEELFTVIKL